MRRIYINEDNGHFYYCHPESDMTPEGVDRLVDVYAENTQVAGIMFCVNVQRALFASKVWEPLYKDYDLNGGADQPCLTWLPPGDRQLIVGNHGRQWVHNLFVLNQRGIDHHARWLARCRHYGIEGWLSMRMNDCHYNQENEDAFWHCTLWKERPDLRRAPYRWERSWEGAFDYSKEEVREHHMKLIRELLERYDMFGLELDWMRWGMDFAPGYEQEGQAILTEFMREVRRLADESAKRIGHPVKLAVRVPAEPQSCLALGYDVITWAEEKLVEMVTLSSMLGCVNFNYPMDIWRKLLSGDIKILTHAEPVIVPYPTEGNRFLSYEFLFASAASAIQRGADGVYLFNECYRESDAPELLKHVLTYAGDLDTLDQTVRRHAVSYPQVRAAGESARTILPIPLRQENEGGDFGRMEENITLRISTGRVSLKATACLRLGFSKDTTELNAQEMIVRINGKVVENVSPTDERISYEDVAAELKAQNDWLPDFPEIVEKVLCYLIHGEILKNDVNVVEFVPPQVEGELVWAEIVIIPKE